MKKYLIFILIILIVGVFTWLVFLPASPAGGPMESLVSEGEEDKSSSSPFADARVEEVIFNVEKGEGLKEIALNLKNENLIISKSLFKIYALVKGIARNLKAGEYLFSPLMNIPQIAEKLFKGDVIKEKITIIEGWNSRNIGFYFENRGMFKSEEVWQAATKDFSSEFNFLKDKPKNLGLEGYFFPDTYEIRENESLESIIRKMLSNFDRKLTPDLREEIERQGKTVFEIVTMASLIEKEVRTPVDKKLVSGLLWKRFKENIPLQVDATIAYILESLEREESEPSSLEGWSFAEMRRKVALGKDIDSPYNTYKYQGFPLGPISNPGLESILAAIEPEESDFWYYLSAPDGKTYFSKTLEEHNIKKAEYLK